MVAQGWWWGRMQFPKSRWSNFREKQMQVRCYKPTRQGINHTVINAGITCLSQFNPSALESCLAPKCSVSFKISLCSLYPSYYFHLFKFLASMTSSNNEIHCLSVKMLLLFACILLLLFNCVIHFYYKIGEMKAPLCLLYWNHMLKK